MSKITTNLDRLNNFVLTDDENRVVAIIQVQSGEHVIDDKLINAITDDTGDTFRHIDTELEITLENSAVELTFDVSLEDPDDDEYAYSKTYYLNRTEIY